MSCSQNDCRNHDSVRDLYACGNSPTGFDAALKRLQRDVKLDRYFFSKYPAILGIEVEVEGIIKTTIIEDRPVLWHLKDDGSLRNNGTELVSVPLQGRLIDYALKQLAAFYEQHKDTIDFSHRCSIHVHVNVGSLPVYKVLEMYATYMGLEPYFLAYVSEIRRNNRFCVPVGNFEISKGAFLHSKALAQKSKYSAFAFNRLKDYGTLELRLHEGTSDIVKIRRWLLMLQKLFLYVYENDMHEFWVGFENVEQSKALAERLFNTVFNFIPPPSEEDLLTSGQQAQFFIAS